MNQPLNPEQTKSAYQLICEKECKRCRYGIPASSIPGLHQAAYADVYPCTAPSKDAVIERLWAENAALRKVIEDAPHAQTCDERFALCPEPCEGCTPACLHHPLALGKKCDCWKSKWSESNV